MKVGKKQRINEKITNETVKKYLGYAVIMLLLGMSEIREGVNPFHLGFFVALVFAGESVYVLAPLYVATVVVTKPAVATLIKALVPAVIMLFAKILHDKTHRRMTIWLANLYAFLSQIPYVIIGVNNSESLIYAVTNIILSQVFTYCAIVVVFAVVVKKLRYKLSTDEKATALLLIMSVSLGLYNIDIFGFRIYYIVLALAVLLLCSVLEVNTAYLICLAIGLGGGIGTRNLAVAGAVLLSAATVNIFIKYNRYYAVIGVVLVDLLCGYFFNAFSEYGYLHIIAIIIGCIIFRTIPKRKIVYLRNIYGREKNSTALKALINRNRIDVNARIDNLAGIFGDLENEMTAGEYVVKEEKCREELTARMVIDICGNCPKKEECFRALGGDTRAVFEPILNGVLAGSKATMNDLPTFLTSRCSKLGEIIREANELVVQYTQMRIHTYDVIDSKRVLGEEIGNIGKVLKDLSKDVMRNISYDNDMEDRIIEELAILGIVCHDVVVSRDSNGEIEITLVVRKCDARKKTIRNVLEQLTRTKLDRSEDRDCEIDGFATVRLKPKPKYCILYGVASMRKDGSIASGDTRSIKKLKNNRLMVALCDGMGSGSIAERNSNNTIGIIEKMYLAGFDNEIILGFANRLLSLRNDENFSALDMCIIDMANGGCDFIKLGGVKSYVRRNDRVESIDTASLPIGILEEAKASIQRRVLADGDMVIMTSDGVSDLMDEEKITAMLLNYNGINPQNLADELLVAATSRGAKDDATVIVLRVCRDNVQSDVKGIGFKRR